METHDEMLARLERDDLEERGRVAIRDRESVEATEERSREMALMHHDHRSKGYITRGFVPDPSDQDALIADEDVIHAENGKYYTRKEQKAFPLKSIGRCPTYGNCMRCYRSGPMNKACEVCKLAHADEQIQYSALFWRGYRLIDADYWAIRLGLGHEPAKANRKKQLDDGGRWKKEAMFYLNEESLYLAFESMHVDNQSNMERNGAILLERMEFWVGVAFPD